MSRAAFRILLLLLVTLAAGVIFPTGLVRAQGASSPDILTLDEALRIALENNRMVRNSLLDVEKAGDRLAAARTRRLPATNFTLSASQLLTPISFQFEQGVFGTYPGIGPVPDKDTKITTPRRPTALFLSSVEQPLSQLYRINLSVKLNELAQSVEREKLRAERQNLVHNVKRAYYAALETESALGATEESLRYYRELERLVGDYVVQQVALKSDGLEVKARLAKEEYTALTLRNALATQKEQLNQLLARDIRTEFRLSALPEAAPVETELAAAQTRALDRRPEVGQARLKVRQAEYDRRIKKSEYIPDISLAFNYISFFQVEVLPPNVARAGFLVSWEPFDWGRKKRELAEKTRTLEQAQNGLREAETQVLLEVNARFRKVEEARALLRVTQMAQEAAREKLRVVMNRYEQKAALLKDVYESQSLFAGASHDYQQAILGFWNAKADFEKAMGED